MSEYEQSKEALCDIVGHEWKDETLMYSCIYTCVACGLRYISYSNTGTWLVQQRGRNVSRVELHEVPVELLRSREDYDDYIHSEMMRSIREI